MASGCCDLIDRYCRSIGVSVSMTFLDIRRARHYKTPSLAGARPMTVDPLTADEGQVAPEDLNEEDKVMLIFSYLWVLAIVPFMVTRREYVRWHAKQGLIL